jgi:acyl-CoA hydrolase
MNNCSIRLFNYYFVKSLSLMISQFRFVTPEMLNGHGTLFGGIIMQWMDEVAYIEATRISRQKMVTVSVDHLKFISPVGPDSFVEINSGPSQSWPCQPLSHC